MKESERLASMTDQELIDEAHANETAIDAEREFYYRVILAVLLVDFIYSMYRLLERIFRDAD